MNVFTQYLSSFFGFTKSDVGVYSSVNDVLSTSSSQHTSNSTTAHLSSPPPTNFNSGTHHHHYYGPSPPPPVGLERSSPNTSTINSNFYNTNKPHNLSTLDIGILPSTPVNAIKFDRKNHNMCINEDSNDTEPPLPLEWYSRSAALAEIEVRLSNTLSLEHIMLMI